jgi:hypothetical protein
LIGLRGVDFHLELICMESTRHDLYLEEMLSVLGLGGKPPEPQCVPLIGKTVLPLNQIGAKLAVSGRASRIALGRWQVMILGIFANGTTG